MFSLLLSNEKCKKSQPINSIIYVYELPVHHRLTNSRVQLHGLNVATSQSRNAAATKTQDGQIIPFG